MALYFSQSISNCNQFIKNSLFDTFAGVVAFIEARSNTENRFEGISKQMEMLGATVSHILQIQNTTILGTFNFICFFQWLLFRSINFWVP